MSNFTFKLIPFPGEDHPARMKLIIGNRAAIIFPDRHHVDNYFVRRDNGVANYHEWHEVKGFLSAQLKALELLGVKDE